MGRIVAPFGVRGWIKVEPYTAEPGNLVAYRSWWVGSCGERREQRVEQAQVHGNSVVAKLAGYEDREAAAALRGSDVAVPRTALPDTGEGEFYWADLIGLQVVNTAGEDLGQISRMIETGANDVLVVEGERERLIPFIAEVVRQVDLAAKVIRVEWGLDY
jgi:16S rRNA processing protein RimM